MSMTSSLRSCWTSRLLFHSVLNSAAHRNYWQPCRTGVTPSYRGATRSLSSAGYSASEDNVAQKYSAGERVCAAYCTHAPISLRALARYFAKPFELESATGVVARPAETHPDAVDVLRVPLVFDQKSSCDVAGSSTPTESHAFFFRSGAVVFWGVPMDIRRELFRCASMIANEQESMSRGSLTGEENPNMFEDVRPEFVRRAHDGIDTLSALSAPPSPSRMEDFEHEFEFRLDSSRRDGCSTFKNDKIYLSDLRNIDEILALSYGLAQSVKLHLSEVAIDALVQRTQVLPKELAENGRISLSATHIRKLIGELLSARYSVNLLSDILDTPEYFWQRPELERLHIECVSAVELKQRSRILNARAEVINDTLHMLKGELGAASSLRLERAILFLIWIEVLFEVARFSGLTAH